MLKTSAHPLTAAMRSAITLRYYQADVCNEAENDWANGINNLLIVLPTGAGKTVCFSYLLSRHVGAACVGAHRQELVGQISLSLAKFGIRHRIIASDKVVKQIIHQHIRKYGTSYVHQGSEIAVASVDTLIRKGKLVCPRWASRVTKVAIDEGHHALKGNKWGRAIEVFQHKERKLLLVTATPERTDGKGLGLGAFGYVQKMIVGPGGRRLINEGYLVPYKIAMGKTDVKFTKDMFSQATGELNIKGIAAMRDSRISADVVDAYLTHSLGERAIVFASDVESSQKIAQQFRDMGIPALHVDGDSDDDVRDDAIQKLERGEIFVLCNVGLFGEGFDLPSIFCVIDAAATESFINYAQRFGRMLRLELLDEIMRSWEDFTPDQRRQFIAESEKPYGLYIDLVGNLWRHGGPPDKPRAWSLDSQSRGGGGGGTSLGKEAAVTCLHEDSDGIVCATDFPRYKLCCPKCGTAYVPLGRASPKMVDGDTELLDEEVLMKLRGEIINLNAPFKAPQNPNVYAVMAAQRDHDKKLDAQRNLRDAFAWWAGQERAQGLTDREIHKLFYLTFDTSTLEAWGLGTKEALELAEQIDNKLTDSSKSYRVKSAY